MRSRQLALCAAVAACAVTTAPAPAYGADDRATGTATVQAAHASRGADTSRGTGGAAGRAVVRSVTVYEGSSRSWTGGSLTAGAGTGRVRSGSAPGAPPALVAASSRELSSTSAVGLVLAGGAILVIAGQLLRLRLRLRRERRGDADER
ncbi:hypothetical protein OG528_13555 [Streptomyces platensis]|uniref:hypothetical protein n=1 Tax=Streptomyces platensis TaxID=58346 RepID=UPI0030E4D764